MGRLVFMRLASVLDARCTKNVGTNRRREITVGESYPNSDVENRRLFDLLCFSEEGWVRVGVQDGYAIVGYQRGVERNGVATVAVPWFVTGLRYLKPYKMNIETDIICIFYVSLRTCMFLCLQSLYRRYST